MNIFLLAWSFSSFGFWANPEATVYPPSQIGVARNIQVGKMACAARLLDLEHVHAWCYKGTRLVNQQVQDISNEGVATIYYYDNKPGETDALITWLVAYVEGNPKTVAYQVTWATDPSKPQHQLSGQF